MNFIFVEKTSSFFSPEFVSCVRNHSVTRFNVYVALIVIISAFERYPTDFVSSEPGTAYSILPSPIRPRADVRADFPDVSEPNLAVTTT